MSLSKSVRMKSLILMAAVILLTPSLAFADETSIEDAISKAVASELGKLESDSPKDKNELPQGKKSPSFSEIGLAFGAGAGSHSAYGANANTSAGLQTKVFLEGSNGKDHGDDRFCTEGDSYHSTAKRDDGTYYSPCGQLLPANVKSRITATVAAELAKIKADRVAKGMKQEDADAKEKSEIAKATAAIEAQMKSYEATYEAKKKVILAKPDARPLLVLEGKAAYNMIGTSEKGGAFTGVEGKVRIGVGGSLKKHGANGCHIYLLATAVGEGRAHYKFDKGNYGRIAVGLEQGPICQIANTVTFMASPSVQAGGMLANDGKGGEVHTDWLNYAGRARLIVDDRVYASGEFVHHPSMSPNSAGAEWKATNMNANIDVKLSDTWIVGGDIRHTKFVDQASAATGNTSIKDTFVGVHAFAAF